MKNMKGVRGLTETSSSLLFETALSGGRVHRDERLKRVKEKNAAENSTPSLMGGERYKGKTEF